MTARADDSLTRVASAERAPNYAGCVQFGILGPLELRTDDGGLVPIRGRRERALLALLVIHAGEVLSVDRLIDALWGETPPTNADNALQALVSRLRKTLHVDGWAPLQTSVPGYVLQVDPDHIDARRFERLLAEADQLADAPERAARQLAQALELWRGPALADVAYEDFAQAEIARLEELRLHAIQARIDAELASGRHAQVIADLERLVREHPLEERFRAQLMIALYRAGRQGDALQVYHQTRGVLAEELGLDPGRPLGELYERILRQDPELDIVAAAPRSAARHNLPARVSSFVGRDAELADLHRLVLARRALTLIGPGGGGKTSLALEVARAAADDFRDGVTLVELGSVSDPSRVAPSVAASLGLPSAVGMEPGEATLEERLSEHLSGRLVLLVLDNCEHLLDVCAELAERLLADCPNLHILATSREPLHISGEVGWAVPPLAVPESADSASDLLRHGATRLFLERAEAARRDFRVEHASPALVSHICRRLDGIPLAIELAAARVSSLPLTEIAVHLDERFRLLTGGPRALARHRTLRTAVDWSFHLLDQSQRTVFCRLGVFAGSFGVEAAAQVAADGMQPDEVLGIVLALADRSLVVAEPGDKARFRLLETIRSYALERLAASGDEGETRSRHAAYFLNLAEDADRQTGDHAVATLEEASADLRAAIDWSLSSGDRETALRIGAALGWFWTVSQPDNGRHQLERILAVMDPETPSVALGRALLAAAMVESGAITPVAVDRASHALRIFDDAGERIRVAESQLALGYYRVLLGGDPREGERLLEEARELFAAEGDVRNEALAAFTHVEVFLRASGDLEVGLQLAQSALRRFGGLSEYWATMFLRQTAIVTHVLSGPTAAVSVYQEAAGHSRHTGLTIVRLYTLIELATLAALGGDGAGARRTYDEALEFADRLGLRAGQAAVADAAGFIARCEGDPQRGREAHDQATALYAAMERPYREALSLCRAAQAAIECDALDEAGRRLRTAANLAEASDQPQLQAMALEGLASVARSAADPEQAALLVGAATRIRGDLALGARWIMFGPSTPRISPVEGGAAAATADWSRREMGDAAFGHAANRGTKMTSQELIGPQPTGR